MTSLYVFSKAGFVILIINLDDPSVDYATRARASWRSSLRAHEKAHNSTYSWITDIKRPLSTSGH
jgi:hypothetical protein